MGGFSIMITCFYVAKKIFETSGMFNKLKPVITWELWKRQNGLHEILG
jgi:hypothetical protein